MQITDVKVFLVGEEKLKAFVSIVLDGCFMVNDIKVIQGREGLFISMPSRKKRNGQFKDVAHPLNQGTRDWMETEILGEYQRCLDDEELLDDDEVEEPSTVVRSSAGAVVPEGRGSEASEAAAVAAARDERSSAPLTSAREGAEKPTSRSDPDDERALDEVQRRHLSDSFWNVS